MPVKAQGYLDDGDGVGDEFQMAILWNLKTNGSMSSFIHCAMIEDAGVPETPSEVNIDK